MFMLLSVKYSFISVSPLHPWLPLHIFHPPYNPLSFSACDQTSSKYSTSLFVQVILRSPNVYTLIFLTYINTLPQCFTYLSLLHLIHLQIPPIHRAKWYSLIYPIHVMITSLLFQTFSSSNYSSLIPIDVVLSYYNAAVSVRKSFSTLHSFSLYFYVLTSESWKPLDLIQSHH